MVLSGTSVTELRLPPQVSHPPHQRAGQGQPLPPLTPPAVSTWRPVVVSLFPSYTHTSSQRRWPCPAPLQLLILHLFHLPSFVPAGHSLQKCPFICPLSKLSFYYLSSGTNQATPCIVSRVDETSFPPWRKGPCPSLSKPQLTSPCSLH